MTPPNHHREGNVVQFRGRGARAQLREAMESRTPVRVAREQLSDAWVHGFVIAMSAEFCVVAEVSEAMRFDGFVVIAAGDVTTVEHDPGRAFVEKALELNGEKLPALPHLVLDEWANIAKSAATENPLISLNMLDEGDGEVSYIGRLTGTVHDALVLQEVDPNAKWYPDTGEYEFAGIGSISFGTRYMHLLAQIAGGPPVPVPTSEFSV
ncbi:MAG TPA: hypothetical protein VH082_05755 [Rudaea sp.]|jgi:hypothetical protein|nr:hypothetical protein [Rudaea sp.]